MTELPDLSQLTHEEKDALIRALWAQVQALTVRIAETLVVETESARTGQRSFCRAERSRLSLRKDCIELSLLESRGLPGTVITAHVSSLEVDGQSGRGRLSVV